MPCNRDNCKSFPIRFVPRVVVLRECPNFGYAGGGSIPGFHTTCTHSLQGGRDSSWRPTRLASRIYELTPGKPGQCRDFERRRVGRQYRFSLLSGTEIVLALDDLDLILGPNPGGAEPKRMRDVLQVAWLQGTLLRELGACCISVPWQERPQREGRSSWRAVSPSCCTHTRVIYQLL